MVALGVGFGAMAVGHMGADLIAPWIETNYPDLARFSLTSSFFWLIVIATTVGLVLSFTKARKLEGVGASRWGSVFIYILVATIGMKMNLGEVFQNLGLFAIGIIWMLIHERQKRDHAWTFDEVAAARDGVWEDSETELRYNQKESILNPYFLVSA